MAYKCLDCKDTKIYQGLGEPEPCRSCRFDAVQRKPRLNHGSVDKSGKITFHVHHVNAGPLAGTEGYVISMLTALPGVMSVQLIDHGQCQLEAVVDGGDDYAIAKTLFGAIPRTTVTVGTTAIVVPWYGGSTEVRFSRPGR